MMPVKIGSMMKSQSSEWRARETGVQNIVPKDVAQSKTMWDAIPTAAKSQSFARDVRRANIFATSAIAIARNGRTRNECVQLRWSRRYSIRFEINRKSRSGTTAATAPTASAAHWVGRSTSDRDRIAPANECEIVSTRERMIQSDRWRSGGWTDESR